MSNKSKPKTRDSIILFNKPYGVISQFSASENKTTLKQFIKQRHFYPAGRLDHDSEGLLILTNSGQVQHLISHPNHKLAKTYWAQVEGLLTTSAIEKLKQGITLNDGPTLPAEALIINQPDNLWPRNPPIRERKNVPTSWLELTIKEGRNRQVRRMTAAVGFPTLRLIRSQVGAWGLQNLQPGQIKTLTVKLDKQN